MVFGFLQIYAQSPHGDSFKVNCATCHTPSTWEINIDTFKFDHDTTNFVLEGVHLSVDCKTCHTTLLFDEAPTQCIACHSDVHSMSVGNDCVRCHTSQNWLVDNIPQIHEENGFPLVGAHDNLACVDCHTSETHLRFGRNGNDCVSCHREDYQNTSSPDHTRANFSTNCIDCHDPLPSDWKTDIISNHDFFPLTKGHEIEGCKQCHLTDDFSDTSPNCITCHQTDFNESVNPNHTELNLPTECASCHTTDLEWKPASFDIHDEFYPLNGAHAAIANDCATCHNGDYNNTPNTCVGCHQTDFENTTNPNHSQTGFSTSCVDCHNEENWTASTFDHDSEYFPIYSGTHEGEWSECVDCHTNPDNFAEFTCVTCHTNPETDNEHDGVGGYVYESTACLACHPTGDSDSAFDHDATNFPLTGEHLGVACLDCHSGGFEGTSTVCVDCHQVDFNQSVNPNHTELNIPTDCATCHTTEADWMPASFDIHDDYYVLVGAHAAIANDCATCHNGDYNNTPNTCVGCHQTDFDNTNDPNHASAGFPTDCTDCHNQSAWEPSTFDHDGQYFPIYSGAHEGEWDTCADCHTNPNNFSVFSCLGCHLQGPTANDHDDVNGYIYESNACLACHPDGEE